MVYRKIAKVELARKTPSFWWRLRAKFDHNKRFWVAFWYDVLGLRGRRWESCWYCRKHARVWNLKVKKQAGLTAYACKEHEKTLNMLRVS